MDKPLAVTLEQRCGCKREKPQAQQEITTVSFSLWIKFSFFRLIQFYGEDSVMIWKMDVIVQFWIDNYLLLKLFQ